MGKPPISSDMAFRRAEQAIKNYRNREPSRDYGLLSSHTGEDSWIEPYAKSKGFERVQYHVNAPQRNTIDAIIIAKNHPRPEELLGQDAEQAIKGDIRAAICAQFLAKLINKEYLHAGSALVIEDHIASLNYLARSEVPFGTAYVGQSLVDGQSVRNVSRAPLLFHAFDALTNQDVVKEHAGLHFARAKTNIYGIDHPDFRQLCFADTPAGDIKELTHIGKRADYLGIQAGKLARSHDHLVMVVGPLDLFVMRSEGIGAYFGEQNVLSIELPDQVSN